MIYILRTSGIDPSFLKIGYTKNKRTFKNRIADLQVGNPFQLELVKLFEGGQDIERQLHLHHAHHNVQGEWFRDNAEMRLSLGIAGPIAPQAATPEPMTDRHSQILNIFKDKRRYAWTAHDFSQRFNVSMEELEAIPVKQRNFTLDFFKQEDMRLSAIFQSGDWAGERLIVWAFGP